MLSVRARLQERVPFQYLLHTAHWADLVLAVGPGVLVPRPETEGLLSLAADALTATPQLAAAPWADLGTGSGAIAIGLARLLRRARGSASSRSSSGSSSESGAGSSSDSASAVQQQQQPCVLAVDVSPTALAYASANAASAGVAGDVALLAGSWLAPLLAAGLAGRLGGLVSNPPYIPAAEMAGLQPEVGRHEPHGALAGGPGPGLDSLQVRVQAAQPSMHGRGACAALTLYCPACTRVRAQVIVAGAAELLMPGGFLALEVRWRW